MNPRFLIVEDEPITARFISEIIEENGYDVIDCVKSAREARQVMASERADILIVDINIQGSEDGIQLSRALMEKNIAVVFISAYNDSQTLQEASATMPYAFLVKPFREADLVAALHMVISRVKKEYGEKMIPPDSELISECWVDEENLRLYWYKQTVELSKKECAVLKLFLNNINTTVNLEELRETVWGEKSIGDSTIRELINRIRNKVDNLSIENVYGAGYMLKM